MYNSAFFYLFFDLVSAVLYHFIGVCKRNMLYFIIRRKKTTKNGNFKDGLL